MKILSMTATFGKLEHQTLTLNPKLNIIEAPNEWGKSTWCAFLVAMFYGIETRVHSTKNALADKERYAPWSGSPMSGRMDILWNDREITLERSTKGRSVFGVFRAYETTTGLPVPELTADNCGQVLLGVEKEVFLRAGFLKLTDMPVTPDKALRRRLNDLVTTGDESGASDALAQKLKDLKNRCRFNKSGLLPQAEAQWDKLKEALDTIYALQSQADAIQLRQEALEGRIRELENHRSALQYAENQNYTQKRIAAGMAKDNAKAQLEKLEASASQLPDEEITLQTLSKLRQLRDKWDTLQMEARFLSDAPQAPESPSVFRGMSPQEAVSTAQQDFSAYQTLMAAQTKHSPLLWILGLILILVGVTLLLLQQTLPGLILGCIGLVASVIGVVTSNAAQRKNEKNRTSAQYIFDYYRPLPPEQWIAAAESYQQQQAAYLQSLTQHKEQRQEMDGRLTALRTEMDNLTGGTSLSQCEEKWKSIQATRQELEDARREYHRAEEFYNALSASHKETPAPAFPDTLSYTPAETARLLSDATAEQRQLHLKLGQCLGQMDSLGQASALQQQLSAVENRIRKLEDTYAALTLAQETLLKASNELQRRFAPRISARAQMLFARLTGNRYNRLSLDQELSLSVATQEEDTLRSCLWRSDGTVDQLYLALRLAVADELTPDAPLVLDDALVRFDDTRLAAAMTLLKESDKQVILFTCQSRESAWLKDA